MTVSNYRLWTTETLPAGFAYADSTHDPAGVREKRPGGPVHAARGPLCPPVTAYTVTASAGTLGIPTRTITSRART